MRKIVIAALVAVAGLSLVLPASALYEWSFDFATDPTTEWSVNNLNWALDPVGTPVRTAFTWDGTLGVPYIETLDYLEYNPTGSPTLLHVFSQSATYGNAIQVSPVVVTALGFDVGHNFTEAAIVDTVAVQASYAASLDLSSIAWTLGAPRFIKLSYETGFGQGGERFILDSVSYSVTPVPEPGTLLIGASLVGLSGFSLRRRARKNKAQS